MELFKLFGSIYVDSDAAQQSIAKTTQEASSFADKLSEGIATAAKWSAAIVGATTAAIGSMIGFSTSTAKNADEIDKMSQKLGLSREAYQEWDYVLSQAGVDINSMGVGMKTLTNKIEDAKNGSASAQQMFAALGLSMEDLATMSREDIFEATIASMQGMEDSTERAALANDLFGKSGQNLIPLFNATAESTQGLIDKSHELGMIMSDEQVDAGVQLVDTMDTLKRAFGGVFAQLGSALVPMVQKFCDMILKYMPQIQDFFSRLEPVITKLFDGLLPPLMDLAEQLMPIIFDMLEQILPPLTEIIQAILPVITELLAMLLPPLVEIIGELLPVLLEVLGPILDLLGPILQLLEPILNIVMALVKPLVDMLNMILLPLTALLSELIEGVLSVLTPIIEGLANVISGVLNVTLGIIIARIEAVQKAFTVAWEVISAVWSVVADFFSDIWDSITDTFKPVIDFFSDLFKGAWDSITKAFSSVSNFFSDLWEDIKRPFTNVADWFKNVFEAAWSGVRDVFSVGGKIFDGIKDGIASVFTGVVSKIIDGINTVIAVPFDAINGILNTIRGIKIPVINVKPFSGLWDKNPLPVPQIPPIMEEGGILEKGQIGLLEGNGAEAVVPLEKNEKWIKSVARDMNEIMGNADVSDKLDDLKDAFNKMADNLSNLAIYLDTGELVGQLTPAFDAAFGDVDNMRKRGA